MPFQNIDLFTDSLAWMGGTPRGNPLLDRVQLFGGDVGSDQLAVGGVLLLILPLDGGGQVKPEVGLDIIVRNALADGVEHAERGFCGWVSLLGSFAIPLGGLNHVAGKALAPVAIERGKMQFAGDETLLGGFAVPLRS